MPINTLQVDQLRAELRKKDNKVICWQCGQHKATDIHHLNGHHHDDHPENLAAWCKLCHDRHHGISAELNDLALVMRQFYGIQDLRLAMANRIAAYGRYGYQVEHAQQVLDETVNLERLISRRIQGMVNHEPIYQAWLMHVEGIGHILAAGLITAIKTIGRFEKISPLWAYSGTHVVDGQAPRRKAGITANWNNRLKILVTFKIPAAFIKKNDPPCFGRQLYDQYKAFYEQVHDERCPVWSNPKVVVNKAGTKAKLGKQGCSRKGHIHNMAKRKVGKMFLACLWLAWRKLEGLPITEPYATRLDGHSQIIQPEDWLDAKGKELYQNFQRSMVHDLLNAVKPEEA